MEEKDKIVFKVSGANRICLNCHQIIAGSIEPGNPPQRMFEHRHNNICFSCGTSILNQHSHAVLENSAERDLFEGSHPDSLYRVPTGDAGRHSKTTRAFRLLRWPAVLIIVCIALGTFVYFLMPDTNEIEMVKVNKAGAHLHHPSGGTNLTKSAASTENNADTPKGAKTSEIDFYDTKSDNDLPSLNTGTESNGKRKLPIPPIFPSKIVPEVQYGNERADTEKGRASNVLTSQSDKQPEDSTLKPHITQKPEKPLAIYFKNGAGLTTTSTETFLDAETSNDFIGHGKPIPPKTNTENLATDYSVNVNLDENNKKLEIGTLDASHRFTSGHSNLFGISIEDAEKLKSTTQSSVYNTRVSPTLPVWREGDTTTNKYPLTINADAQPQCQSTQIAQCLGVLPYDLTSINSEGKDVSSYLPHFEYMFSTNCSLRLKQFACVLMEPECNAPPLKSRKPCYNFCKSVMDGCEDRVPQELVSLMQCEQYTKKNCVKARSPCFDNEMLCGDSSCIPRDWKCDGKIDCPAGEDEAKCGKCSKDEFQCPTGECILKRWLCDGYDDCAKGEDETEGACRFVGSQKINNRPRADLGEEFSGSAPAPSVRRPNQTPLHKMRHPDFHKADDNSRELLMTSDTGHPYRRNYTRRPPASRLTPYKRPVLYDPRSESSVEILKNSTQPEIMKISPKNPNEMRPDLPKSKDDKTGNKMDDNTDEDVDIGDINFLANYQKRIKKIDGSNNKPIENPRIQKYGRAPGPPPEKTTMKSPTRLDKSINKFEIEIDGMELIKKNAKNTPKFVPTDSMQNDDVSSDTQKKISNNEPRNETLISAHASPCPMGELRCVDGRCITLSQLCDGTIDCTDHADEDNCYT